MKPRIRPLHPEREALRMTEHTLWIVLVLDKYSGPKPTHWEEPTDISVMHGAQALAQTGYCNEEGPTFGIKNNDRSNKPTISLRELFRKGLEENQVPTRCTVTSENMYSFLRVYTAL